MSRRWIIRGTCLGLLVSGLGVWVFTCFDVISIGLLIAFAAATWWLPRHFGVIGMVLVHISLLVAYFCLAAYAMHIGRYQYDGATSFIGLAAQAFVINCALLPIALPALWCRRKSAQREAARGFPVEPLASRGQNPGD